MYATIVDAGAHYATYADLAEAMELNYWKPKDWGDEVPKKTGRIITKHPHLGEPSRMIYAIEIEGEIYLMEECGIEIDDSFKSIEKNYVI